MTHDDAIAVLRNWARWSTYEDKPLLGYPPPATTRNYRRSNADDDVWKGEPETAASPPPNEQAAIYAENKILTLSRHNRRLIIRYFLMGSHVDELDRDAAIRAFCDVCYDAPV
jgi:hypothetical protein